VGVVLEFIMSRVLVLVDHRVSLPSFLDPKMIYPQWVYVKRWSEGTPTTPGRYSTGAISVARFTLATRTPVVLLERAFSTRRAQAAHVIPETGRES
jgi:hypothetical protein